VHYGASGQFHSFRTQRDRLIIDYIINEIGASVCCLGLGVKTTFPHHNPNLSQRESGAAAAVTSTGLVFIWPPARNNSKLTWCP